MGINEHAKSDLVAIMDEFQGQMRMIADTQAERAKLIATGVAQRRDAEVAVTVNAAGVVIETRFSIDIDELSYGEIANAVTEAAQAAAAEMARRNKVLTDRLNAGRTLPKLEDIIEGLPDLRASIPVPPPISTTPPALREEAADAPARDGGDYRDVTTSDW